MNVLLAALAGVEKGSRASAAHGTGVTGAFVGVAAYLAHIVIGVGQASGIFQSLFVQVGVDFFPSDVAQKPVDIVNAALKEAKLKFYDVLLVDTAGRLHVDEAMMDEIKQVHASIKPVETLFVVDAMTGQDAANTAKAFNEALPLTGVVLTKLDGTAKGGVVLSIHEELHVPIRWIGLGEREDDLQRFNALEFAKALFETEDHVLRQSTKV